MARATGDSPPVDDAVRLPRRTRAPHDVLIVGGAGSAAYRGETAARSLPSPTPDAPAGSAHSPTPDAATRPAPAPQTRPRRSRPRGCPHPGTTRRSAATPSSAKSTGPRDHGRHRYIPQAHTTRPTPYATKKRAVVTPITTRSPATENISAIPSRVVTSPWTAVSAAAAASGAGVPYREYGAAGVGRSSGSSGVTAATISVVTRMTRHRACAARPELQPSNPLCASPRTGSNARLPTGGRATACSAWDLVKVFTTG